MGQISKREEGVSGCWRMECTCNTCSWVSKLVLLNVDHKFGHQLHGLKTKDVGQAHDYQNGAIFLTSCGFEVTLIRPAGHQLHGLEAKDVGHKTIEMVQSYLHHAA
jgi:hypothetical protein